MVRVPQVADIRAAIELYWSKIEIGTNDICALFGGIGRERAGKLKAWAREEMQKRGTVNFNPMYVNTEVAYEVWGLKINDLERRYNKLKQYRKEG